MKQIYVYSDLGVDPDSLIHTIKSLQKGLAHFEESYRIQRIGASSVINGAWKETAALFVMPGGRDIFYLRELGALGADQIRSFVEAGGNYLGICAGAYFAASAIEFERGGEFEVMGSRPLAFFPGVASGPALGLGRYAIDSHRGAEAALVEWDSQKGHIYYNGGPTFSTSSSPNVEVLARYVNLESPALLSCQFGKGKALLSGVHFEYSTHNFSPTNPDLHRIYPLLQRDEEEREELFQKLLLRVLK